MKRHLALRLVILTLGAAAAAGNWGCRKRAFDASGGLAAAPPERFLTRNSAPAAEEPKAARAPARPQQPAAIEGRKLIRTGQVSVEVKDFAAASRQAAAIAERFGGYIASSRSSKDEAGKTSGDLTLRVAAEHLEEAFRDLGALGRVESENVATEDITKAYYDLEGRIRVARDAEGRIREILRNRAAKLSEVLEAEKELTRVVGEIEQMEGERRFYDRQTSLSTITASLHEPQSIARPGSLSPLKQAIHDSAGAVATSVATLIYLVMYGLPWVVVLGFLWLLIRRARRARK